ELEEIESVLERAPGLRECAVAWRGVGGGEPRLVAYVAGQESAAGEWRRWASERLADYMVPARWVELEALPRTISGKVDRRRLPDVEPVRGETDYVEPRTPIEEMIAEVWAEVLGLERVGAHDDFFHLGGHSLLATQVVNRLRDLCRVELPLRALFEGPTVSGLAGRIERELRPGIAAAEAPVERLSERGQLELSFAQQRLWFLEQLEGQGSGRHNMTVAVGLEGDLDQQALERSLNEVVLRHEVLRTHFEVVAGQPVQVVDPAFELGLEVDDLSLLPRGEREEAVSSRLAAVRRTVFDLNRGPLLRSLLLRLDEREYVLSLVMHHIVSDAWSMGVLVRELGALYEGYREGREPGLAELPVQYGDFAVWQRRWLQGPELERQMGYWRERLAGAPAEMEDLADRPRPESLSGLRGEQRFEVEDSLYEGFKRLAQREGVSHFMALLGLWQFLLWRYSGQGDVVVGTPIANRNRREIEGLIGFFVNTLVLRTDVAGAGSFRDLLARVREVTLGAYAHQDLPFEKLVEELKPERSLSRAPLFQVLMVLQNAPMPSLELSGLKLKPIEGEGRGSREFDFDLVLVFNEGPGELSGLLTFSEDLFEAAKVERMVGHFVRVLEQAVEESGRGLRDVELLSESEQRQLLGEWGWCGEQAGWEQGCVHEAFSRQARRTPEAEALRAAGRIVRYGELEETTNRMARALRQRGAGRGETVVMRVGADEVSEITSLLAILKTGAAFACVDAGWPDARVREAVEELSPVLVLQEQPVNDEELAGHSGEPLAPSVSADEPAYVVYTSGSTGRPKGIRMPHRGLYQFVGWFQETFRLSPGRRMAQWASLAYDASYCEIFAALTGGATLCVAGGDLRRDPVAVASWVAAEGIDVLQVVPSFCRQLLSMAAEPLAGLSWMLVAGEVLPAELARNWLRRYGESPRLCNLYGPAESILASWQAVDEVEAESRLVPVGRPLAGRRVVVADVEGRLCPAGVKGELWVTGRYLMSGYTSGASATEAVLVPDPWSGEADSFAYRTGDLGRWRADGRLEFWGRRDNQVKVRGMRVELEEIESVLERAPGLRECAVAWRGAGGGEPRLVAYVAGQESAAGEWRRWASERLPDYMVPAQWVEVDELPRTTSGKVDRRHLPEAEP